MGWFYVFDFLFLIFLLRLYEKSIKIIIEFVQPNNVGRSIFIDDEEICSLFINVIITS